MPPLPFYNRADQPEQEKSNMHAACARHSWIDSSLFVFSCVEKGIEFCSDSRRVLGFNLLNARRGVKPTPCDVRSATSGCN